MKILISCFGSGGDLFPLFPVAENLRLDGHEVTFACPRTLGLYARALGFATIALGSGHEARVLQDDVIFTTAFGGWASWHRTWDEYVEPALVESHATVARAIATDRPDVVVTTTFAAAARIAALAAGVPHVALSIYPQYHLLADQPAKRAAEFATRYRHTVHRLAGPRLQMAHGSALVLWGVDRRGPLLHEADLLTKDVVPPAVRILGFPVWDSPHLGSLDELETTRQWMTMRGEPALIVTQGSFIGRRGIEWWRDTVDAVTKVGRRAVLVGASGRWADEAVADRDDLLATGYLPLSEIAPLCQAAVHHGGLGTTMTFLRAGVPALVRPQAFDQVFNAALVEQAGVGVDGRGADTPGDVAGYLDALLDRDRSAVCHELRRKLVPAEVAARCTADLVHSAASR